MQNLTCTAFIYDLLFSYFRHQPAVLKHCQSWISMTHSCRDCVPKSSTWTSTRSCTSSDVCTTCLARYSIPSSQPHQPTQRSRIPGRMSMERYPLPRVSPRRIHYSTWDLCCSCQSWCPRHPKICSLRTAHWTALIHWYRIYVQYIGQITF